MWVMHFVNGAQSLNATLVLLLLLLPVAVMLPVTRIYARNNHEDLV